MDVANEIPAGRKAISRRDIALGVFALAALAVAIVFAVLFYIGSANASSASRKAQSREARLASQIDTANRMIDECHSITAAMADSIDKLGHANDVYDAAILTGSFSGLSQVKLDQQAALSSLQSVKVKDCR